MSLFTKNNKQPKNPEVILDTCAVIDGRITAIVQSGFVLGNIIIPQFVIAELQYLADNGDSHKRERARFGLDIIRELQDMRNAEVVIAREKFDKIQQVDDKLIALAKLRSAMLYTTDYNLNKVAQIEGVTVLNVNELAQALRPNHLPGERLEVKITQTGQEKTQGVGYLDDGTMVVVEKAGNRVGQRIGVELSRMLQTQAGKMVFATIPDARQQQQKRPAQLVKQQNAPAAQQPAVNRDPSPSQKQNQTQQNNNQPRQNNSPRQQQPNRPRPQLQRANKQQQPNQNRPQQSRPRSKDIESALLQAVDRQQD